ncbi:MAG: ABC transporter permease [Deltaproteobacteria bacterium]|jgi:NitT/TauT family transport system permease protein|nr:ABC transporter permease [Deltaproteobacteria bacterium]
MSRKTKTITFSQRLHYYFRRSIAVILFLSFWAVGPHIGLIDHQFIPSLGEVLETIWEHLLTLELIRHLLVSLRRALLGFALALSIGLPLGFALGGWFRRVEEYLNPLLSILSQINPFSIFPVFILMFGIGEITKVIIIFWICVWPILFNTIQGVKSLDPMLIKAAVAMGTTKFSLFSKVVLPGSASHLFAGFKSGAAFAFLMLIAAEMIGASSGLGWLILNSQVNFQIKRLFMGIVTVALLGLAITALINWIESKVIIWKESNILEE